LTIPTTVILKIFLGNLSKELIATFRKPSPVTPNLLRDPAVVLKIVPKTPLTLYVYCRKIVLAPNER
jgi:hypothetical protein